MIPDQIGAVSSVNRLRVITTFLDRRDGTLVPKFAPYPLWVSVNQVMVCFIVVYLFIFERDRESTSGAGAEREREGERESQMGSTLSAQTPTWGSSSQSGQS